MPIALPEPRPEDHEDVVWGLSTATALWARGEKKDAIVWIRRAADAARTNGQDFRASELDLDARALDENVAIGTADEDEGEVRLSTVDIDIVEGTPIPA